MKRGRIARALAGLVLLACWPLAVGAATIKGSIVAQHDATALSGMTVSAYP